MKKMKFIIIAIVGVLFSFSISFGQSGHNYALEFDKTVHNFGKISVTAGIQKCSFNYTNVSDKPVVINNVISSCGCSVAEWDKAPIKPGAKGAIEVSYLNDQGPYPFDKTFTVYISSSEKPIMLRITGIVFEKGKSIAESFPAKYGPIGMKSYVQNGGQIEQGLQRTESESIVNLSDKAIKVTFANVSPGLKISVKPSTIQPGESAIVSYTIDTKGKNFWGKTKFYATFVCNGVEQKPKFVTETSVVTPYTSLTKEQLANAPEIEIKKSSVEFGKVKVGQTIKAQYTIKNKGKSNLIIYKVETNGASVKSNCPSTIKSGESVTVDFSITPKRVSSYEIFTITLVTNTPDRPIINLHASGEITK